MEIAAWSRGYIFMLNSDEHEISTVHKNKMLRNKDTFFSCFQTLKCCIYHAYEC